MTFSVKPGKGNREVELRIAKGAQSTIRGIRQAFYFLGKDLKADANKNILERPRSGRVYKFKGRRHKASVAGETFANRSGAARRKLGYDVKGGDQLEFGFRADSETLYTKILEEELDRPTLKIATRDNQRNARKHFEREIERAHKDGFK
jgi:hypothetical protein